ncbi:MAG: PASTA domain-containing protein [Oscillospiraceae bacterium]|nr:PASTA domain-containing protein [Oscillospiraceae bacterium]
MAQPPKRRPQSARRANRIIQRRTLLLLLIFGLGAFVLLFGKLYHWQITEHNELESLAVRQQTMRTTVGATRGSIYDSKGRLLAQSATAENIFLSPKEIEENEQDKNLIARTLAEILDLDEESILKRMERTFSQYEVIKTKVEQDDADRVRSFISENKIRGVFLEPTSKRYYPRGSLASHVIGFANDAGGAYGLEAVYDQQLTGEGGMVVTAKNAKGTSLLYQYEQYFDARDGYSINTTIDATIQYFLEKGLAEMEARFGTGKGATGIVLDVNTGAVLGMASLPNYDLNNPSAIFSPMLTGGADPQTLPDETVAEMRLKQWRNKAINDTYEPGSTFKILTLSMALEEGVVDLNSTFNCSGSVNIEGATINCSNRKGHGHQTLTQATGNSCNPAFINIGLRVGNEKFYNYMKAFGLTEKTGIDTTGEAKGMVNSEITYSTLALACYAFGQNFLVTPMALISAQAACVNGGYLHTPYIVSEVVDENNNVISRHDTTPVRQVISEETSATVRGILEYVVAEGTGKNGRVAGYRVGGKTGTADKHGGNIIVSFTCFAPADNPQVIMLLTLDEPQRNSGTYASGGNMVAPIASSIMSEILPYIGVEPNYTAEELVGADATVPNVINLTAAEAAEKLSSLGFSSRTVGNGETVTDQTPVGGAIVPNNAEIILYLGAEKPDTPSIVPNVLGDSASTANQKLTNAGLIMSVSGATGSSTGSVRVITQSEQPGNEVPAGTVVRVQLSDSSVTD